MNFNEACMALYDGKKIRKTSWASSDYIHFKNDCIVTNTDNPWTRPFIGFYSNDDVWDFYHEPLKIVLDEQVILKKGDEGIVLGEIKDFEVIKQELIESLNQASELVVNGKKVARTITNESKRSTVFNPHQDKNTQKTVIKEADIQIRNRGEWVFKTSDSEEVVEVGQTYKFLYREKCDLPTYSEREAEITTVEMHDHTVYKIYAKLTKNDSKYHKQQDKNRVFMPHKIKCWEEV